uniref:Lines homolog 1 n=1 Tax=Oncorhynchus tshawytscha TaxID=74940 RepID=A0AAZ3RHA2_ONCTS
MNEQFHVLNDAYRSLLLRTSPSKMSSHELASSMFTCVCELTLDASDGYHSQHQDQSRDLLTSSKYSPNPNGTELACLVLTLVEKINSKLTSQQLSQETSLYFKDVSTVLFQHMDFMSKLVHLACCKDRLLSHLAAKSVSSYVIFELRCFNTVNQIWEWKCLQVLQNPCSGNELDACTWSLTTVLKAVLKETSEYKPGVCNTIGIHGYLSALLLFLRQRGVQLKQGSHSCCWVSLVFGEQDDDMMEAAKALLLLYLHHRVSSDLEADAVCVVGGNPHCHFLFLLRNISFDHSILLDFLISTETCFLEYFVRYLKHLRDDWEGFRTVCQKIDGSDRCKLSWKISQKDDQLLDNLREELQQSLCASRGSVSTSSHSGGSVTIVDPEPAPCLQPSLCLPSGSATALASTPPLRLVDYGSSEESETEDGDLPSGLTQDRLHSDSVVHTHNSHSFDRTVMCLTELRVVVTRLQRRSLFPYNATSLLKLLTQIEAKRCCSQR